MKEVSIKPEKAIRKPIAKKAKSNRVNIWTNAADGSGIKRRSFTYSKENAKSFLETFGVMNIPDEMMFLGWRELLN